MVLQTPIFSFVLVWWAKRPAQAEEDTEKRSEDSLFAKVMRPVSIGCCAYIGYAVSALVFVWISGVEVDMDAAVVDLEAHFMFVVAFVVHAIFIHFLSRPWLKHKISTRERPWPR